MRIDLHMMLRTLPELAMCCALAACTSDNLSAAADAHDTPTVVREYHPSGPTTRREWRHAPGQQPYRIELDGVRSGRLVVGKARLWRQADGRWTIESSTGQRTTLRAPKMGTAPPPLLFEEGGVMWTVHVTGESVPAPQSGVAQEEEPSLSLVLECRY